MLTACESGDLPHTATTKNKRTFVSVKYPITFSSVEWDGKPGRFKIVQRPHDEEVTVILIAPDGFKTWLAAQKLSPSDHIAAWFDAVGAGTVQTAQPVIAKTPDTEQEATPIQRKDLIDKYLARWPGIDNDLKDGGNGLEKTRIKHGVYDENKVVQWGKDNARFKAEPPRLEAVWNPTNSKQHTMVK